MKPYYYIFRVDGGHPRIKHASLEDAHAESIRLATQHPGDSFEILQCIGTTLTTTPQTFWIDGVIPPHACRMNLDMTGKCFVCGEVES